MKIETDRPKIGIMTDDLGRSQKAYYLIKELNILAGLMPKLSVCCFRGYNEPLIARPQFPLYQHKLAYSFDGILISTEIETANKIEQCWQAKKKFYYVFNLDWQYFTFVKWKDLHNILDNPKISLIARSQQHYDILKKMWKEPSYIMENFNHKYLLEIINNVYRNRNEKNT